MVDSATDLGDRWGVSDVIVGTLVLAALTSLPNLADGGQARAARTRGGDRQRGVQLEQPERDRRDRHPLALPHARSAGGLGTFSIWWLLGMTAVAVVFAYMGHGVRRA